MAMFQKTDNGITIRGWKILSNKGTIGSIEENKEWEEKTMLPVLPEMVFGRNEVVLEHTPTNFRITFNCLDALSAVDHTKAPPISVKASAEWSKGNAAQLLKLKEEKSLEADAIKAFDWTFSSPYQGTISPSAVIVPTDEKINIAKLTAPDPILFYDEVVLYEDELADNGSSHLFVRVRVMPTCLFVLQRLFLRVDGVLFRILDNRYFLEFHKDYLIHEFTHKEQDYDTLVAKFGAESFSSVRDMEAVNKELPIKEQTLKKISFS